MQPVTKNQRIRRGDFFYDTLRVRERVWNPAFNDGHGGWAPGPYLDITGWTGIFQIKGPEDGPLLATGTVQILDQTEYKGGVQYSISGAITADLEVGEEIGVYDVQLTNTDDQDFTVVEGTVSVDPDVSGP